MKIVSLFAGCGGLDLGFEQAGFDVIWANEFDPTIHETYKANHPHTILSTSDIRSITANDVPDCDGIIGGPPCQAWSEGGKNLGIADPRGQLFLDYIRIVKAKQPKFFIIENVQGILAKQHREALSSFINMLADAGYRIQYELLNASDYKIPQDRHRVFFVGIRKDLKNKFNFPNALQNGMVTLKRAIGDIQETPNFYNDNDLVQVHPNRDNHDVYTGAYDAKYMARNRVRSWDECSFTIQAQARNTPQHPQAPKMIYVSANQRIFAKGKETLYRRLSVRECARIQSFPDSFNFIYSNVIDGYKMVGNAVPPRLAYYLAKQFRKTFNLDDSQVEGVVDARPIQTSVEDIQKQYSSTILVNNKLDLTDLSLDKNLLIGLVKADATSFFDIQSDKLYYTGKKFPNTIALNKLYYFMPYIKGKGIRDLYHIKIARIGTKQEVHISSKDSSLRIIFELQFIKQLFDGYYPTHLNIWNTYTDTILRNIDILHGTY